MKTELARRLTELRLRSGLSQKEVAERVNISTQSCSHYETGWRTPVIHTLYRFAQVYQVTPEYLLGYTDESSEQPQLPGALYSLSMPKLAKLNDFLNFVSFSSESNTTQPINLNTASFPEESFGRRLRLFRRQARLSQADMARSLDITVQAYSHYETERRTPSPETFYRIAQIFQISMNHLFTGEPDVIANISEKINHLTGNDLLQVNNYIMYLKCQP
ncbi:MAG: helix-turn-helix domain-containing protein [Firmicutes bacterium]|nr:helix-turn-helix domain-containing protein [Bacillota bacterium]